MKKMYWLKYARLDNKHVLVRFPMLQLSDLSNVPTDSFGYPFVVVVAIVTLVTENLVGLCSATEDTKSGTITSFTFHFRALSFIDWLYSKSSKFLLWKITPGRRIRLTFAFAMACRFWISRRKSEANNKKYNFNCIFELFMQKEVSPWRRI